MSRNTFNRAVDKYSRALQVYCDRGEFDKANRELENLYQALDDLMEFTKTRIRLSKEKRENVQRSEAKRPTPVAESPAPTEGSEADPGLPSGEVPVKKQSKPRTVRKKSE